MSARHGAVAIALAMAAVACSDDDPLVADRCEPVQSVDAGTDQWTTEDGCGVSPDVATSHAGPPECGWELVDYLITDSGTYHWDPVNFLSYVDGRPRNRTLKTAELPADVSDTGLRRGEEALWRDPGDDTYVYIVSGDLADRYLLDRDGVIECR